MNKPLPSPNPETQTAHRRQCWWQIYLPFFFFVVIILTLAVLSTFGSNPQISQWGNISTIFVVAPLLLVLILTFVIFSALAYGLYRLIKVVPPYASWLQLQIARLQLLIKHYANQTAEPVIASGSFWAGVKRIFSR